MSRDGLLEDPELIGLDPNGLVSIPDVYVPWSHSLVIHACLNREKEITWVFSLTQRSHYSDICHLLQ